MRPFGLIRVIDHYKTKFQTIKKFKFGNISRSLLLFSGSAENSLDFSEFTAVTQIVKNGNLNNKISLETHVAMQELIPNSNPKASGKRLSCEILSQEK